MKKAKYDVRARENTSTEPNSATPRVVATVVRVGLRASRRIKAKIDTVSVAPSSSPRNRGTPTSENPNTRSGATNAASASAAQRIAHPTKIPLNAASTPKERTNIDAKRIV